MRSPRLAFRPPVVFGLMALAAIVGGGCAKPQLVGGKERPRRFAQVVSLSPSTTEILGTWGAPLVGRTSADDYPVTISRVPVVAGVKPDYEAIARIKPDLVVYDGQLFNGADVRKIEGLGATTFSFDPKTFAEFERRTYELGSAVALETAAADYINRVRQAMARASGTGTGLSMAIVLPDRTGRPMIAGSKGLLGDFISATGGKAVGPDSDRFVPLDPEFLVKEDPTIVIVAGASADFRADARFAGLAAVKRGFVYGLPPSLVLRRGAQLEILMNNIGKAFGLTAAKIEKQKPASGAAPR